MGMVAHRRPDDVGHLVEAPVVHLPEGVQDAAQDGLEPVVDVGDRAVEDDVARVVEEPVLVAASRAATSVRRCRLGFLRHVPRRLEAGRRPSRP